MTEWIGIPDDISEYRGFVYTIVNKTNDKFYIGQKTFFTKHTLKPLKGYKKKRKKVLESNWREYWGSSKELLEDIKSQGKETFSRRMIYHCKSKAQMNYYETKLQFHYDVLFNDKSYNKIINCRISENQLKNISSL